MKRVFSAALAILTASLAPACGQVSNSETSVATTVDGGHVFYEISGNPNGEPLLMIHGAVVADTFTPLASQGELRNYQLIRYHRRGFGDSSDVSAPFGITDDATDAMALLRHLGIERAHIVGHSYGGGVALQMAIDSPTIVGSLILLEGLVPPQDIVRPETLRSLGERQPRAALPPEEWATALDVILADAIGLENLEKLPDASAQAKADAAHIFEVENTRPWDYDPLVEVPRLQQPILFMMGENGNPLFPDIAEFFRTSQPETTFYTVSDANHSFHVEEPAEVASVIADFLARNPL